MAIINTDLGLPVSAGRGSFIKGALWNRWTAVLGAIYGTATALTWFRDEILAPADVEKYRVVKLIPHWPWYIWAILGLISFLLIVFEAMFREVKQRDKARSELREEMLALKASPADLSPRIVRLYANRIDDSATDWGLTSKAYAFDLFIDVDCDLRAPSQVAVNKYELQMTGYHSDTHTPAGIEDMRDWALVVHKSPAIGLMNTAINDKLAAMPNILFANVPNQGWLHFRTEIMLEDDLTNCGMILIVYTERGPRSSPQTPANIAEKADARAVVSSRYFVGKS